MKGRARLPTPLCQHIERNRRRPSAPRRYCRSPLSIRRSFAWSPAAKSPISSSKTTPPVTREGHLLFSFAAATSLSCGRTGSEILCPVMACSNSPIRAVTPVATLPPIPKSWASASSSTKPARDMSRYQVEWFLRRDFLTSAVDGQPQLRRGREEPATHRDRSRHGGLSRSWRALQ